MRTVRRTSTVSAPFEEVWAFYDGVDELEVLSPDWMGLSIERVERQDDREGYRPGTTIHLEYRPFGVLSLSGEWVVEITEREVTEERAYVVDEQVGDRGPYEEYRHEHAFVDLGDRTRIRDRITYARPYGTDLPVARPMFEAMLWYRHRRTKKLLGDE